MPDANDLPVFKIVREFAAPRDIVWAAWTEPKRMQRWLGPKGTQATSLKFELRPGGMSHTRLAMPGGGAMYARWDFEEIEPPRKLVYMHGVADENANFAKHPMEARFPTKMLTTVLFDAMGEKTRVTLTWTPFAATPEEVEFFRAAMPGMSQGWEGSFEQLDVYLAQ
jgi:uncharacterized protein YndB with AHSA1/START domain